VWLRQAAERLKALGLSDDRVLLDESHDVVTDKVDVLGYYSWGSNDPSIRQRHFGLKFRPGAIGGMFVSTDGRTFREPPQNWTLANWNDQTTWFAGSPQSLAGDLIREGITGVSGHVSEPLLGNTIRPDILFPAYVSGFSLAEAFYLAMPSVSWMTVVVGDPLCAPFANATTRRVEDPPLDPATELPAVFSQRRLAALRDSSLPLEVQQKLLRADSRTLRGDAAGARSDLEEATDAVPTLLAAQILLAANYETAGDYDAAIARYRTILSLAPDTPLALNNLAYALAVRKGELREAQPLAERARKLAPQSGVIADTLGWIYFISGDAGRAQPLLSEAARLEPANPEIQQHLATVRAALGGGPAAKPSQPPRKR
jgi:Flp pilus assembly protein TadD